MAKERKRDLARQAYGPVEPDRRRPTSIPQLVIDSFVVTQSDLANRFCVFVSFTDIQDVPDNAKSYPVVGHYTIEKLAGRICGKLCEERCLFSPESELDLYRKDGVLLDPSSTVAEALKISKRDCDGDGISLELTCVVKAYWFGSYEFDEGQQGGQ